jgi:hypothetical protein
MVVWVALLQRCAARGDGRKGAFAQPSRGEAGTPREGRFEEGDAVTLRAHTSRPEQERTMRVIPTLDVTLTAPFVLAGPAASATMRVMGRVV